MSDTVPPGRRIDGASLERILQRAAELQATERDLSEGLTEKELLQLGDEVGLSATHLRRAIIEEKTRATVTTERGFAVWLAGPRVITAERVLDMPTKTASDALHWWMEEGELLQVKRRFPDATTWETKRGALAAMKRSFRSGHAHVLARALDVSGVVHDLGDGRCHVRLTANLSKQRQDRLTGAAVMAAGGVVTTAVAIGLGVAEWAALLATPLGGLFGYGVARTQMNEIQRMQVALEQVLDRLEHGEVKVPRLVEGPRASAFLRIADEIKKSLGA